MQLEENEHKIYGLTQDITNDDEYMVFNKFWSKRKYENSICEYC